MCRRSFSRPGLRGLPSCTHFSRLCPPFQARVVKPNTSTFTAQRSSVRARISPHIAATVIGDVRDISRFPGRDNFAACNGTAPVEVSSGNRKIHRLSLRGNRRINHAIHMAAITQISHRHSDGRAYYDKKLTEGKTHKEALRCLKRRISDAVFARLQADARQASASQPVTGPGEQPGNDSASSAAGSHPARQLFGQATPGPGTSLRPGTTTGTQSKPVSKKTQTTT